VPIRPYAALFATASAGIAPSLTLGGALHLGVRRGALSVALEGRIENTVGDADVTPRDRFRGTAYFGGLAPCVSVDPATFCLGARIGSIDLTALDVERPTLTSAFAAAAFARAGVAFPIARSVAIGGAVEGIVPFVRTSLVIDGQPVWTVPAGQASFLLGATVSLP